MNFLESLARFFAPEAPEKFGSFLNPEDDRDLATAMWKPIISASSFPEKVITDIAFIPVQDQKRNGSCVGQAVGNEIEYRIVMAGGDPLTDTSRRFIYAFAKKMDGLMGEGTYPRVAYKIGTTLGCANATLVPNDNDLAHDEYIDVPKEDVILDNAKEFRLKSYATINSDVDSFVQEVVESGVFTATLDVDRITFKQSGRIQKPKKVTARHRVLIYGYEKEGSDYRFYFRNSWGINWGTKGNGSFLWKEYEDHVHDATAFMSVPAEYLQQAKASEYIFKPSIRYGQSGEPVLQLQKKLQREGYYPHGWELLTGYYGDVTANAVLRYQNDKKIAPTSELLILQGKIVGPATIKALNGGKLPSLLSALIQVESEGNDGAIGDKNLVHMAYGPLQIRQPYVDDVNRVFGSSWKAEQMLNNRQISTECYSKYMSIYATEARLGRPVTDEDRARIHNGGPNGYKSPATVKYWAKVKAVMYA